ncbi:MAG: hypothetical protein VKL42_22365, partial [Snowella sp.]|nr:hypothetical protein [Snowella sp.]
MPFSLSSPHHKRHSKHLENSWKLSGNCYGSPLIRNRSGGNQENAPHGIGRNHDEKVVVIDFIAIILSSKSPMSSC